MSEPHEFPDVDEVIEWVKAKPDDWACSITDLEC